MDFKSLKNKPLIMIIAIAVSIALIIGVYFLHAKMKRDILKMNLERQKLVQTGIGILDFKNKYGDLDEYLTTIEERYQLSENSLPTKMDQGEFINFFQRTAAENQVQITAITPGQIQPLIDTSKDNSEEISADELDDAAENDRLNGKSKSDELINHVIMLPINLKIDCAYLQLLNFLKAIENSERVIQIKNLSIVSKDDGERLICELIINIFALEFKDRNIQAFNSYQGND